MVGEVEHGANGERWIQKAKARSSGRGCRSPPTRCGLGFHALAYNLPAAPVVSCGRGLGYRWDRGRGGDCGCWGSAVMMLTAGIEADDG